MSNIAIVIPYAFPETGAASMRANSFALALMQKGHHPIVFAPEKGLSVAQTEYTIVRFRNKRSLGRLFTQHDIKLVIASTPPADLGMWSLFYAKLAGIPIFADIRDPWVFDKAAAKLINSKSIKFLIQKEIEKWFYVLADERFVVTQKTAHYFEKELGISEKKFKLIPNGVQTELFEKIPKNTTRKSVRAELGIPSQSVVFLFLGSIWRDLPELIRQLKPILIEKKAHLLIVGNTDNKSTDQAMKNILQVVKDKGLQEQIHLRLNIPAKDIPPFLRASDIGINVVGEGHTYSVTVKTYEYAYAKLPILSIGPRNGALSDFYHNLKSGFFCDEWGEFQLRAKKIVNSLPEQKKLAALDSKFISENFSRSKWSNFIAELVEEHLRKRHHSAGRQK